MIDENLAEKSAEFVFTRFVSSGTPSHDTSCDHLIARHDCAQP